MRKGYRVRDVMTPNPVTAKVGETVLEAVKKMDAIGVGAIPVVDSDGNLVGIFTERDLVRRVVAKGLDPAKVRIEEVMTPNPFTIGPDDPVEEAIRIMSKVKARHLPVVDETGRLIGIISITDIEFVSP